MSLSAPRQLLLPQLLSPQSARGLPWGERVGWRQRPLCHTAANHAAITLCCHPEDWQEGVMSLSGPRGCGKSFMAWYFFLVHAGLAAANGDNHGVAGMAATGMVIGPDMIFINQDTAAMNSPAKKVLVWDGIDSDLPHMTAAAAESLCHFFNRPVANRPRLLLISRRPLQQLLLAERNNLLPDLWSRLQLVPATAIEDGDDALLRAQLIGSLAERQVVVEERVITSLLRYAPRGHQQLAELIEQLDEESLALGRPLSMGFIHQWLQQQFL